MQAAATFLWDVLQGRNDSRRPNVILTKFSQIKNMNNPTASCFNGDIIDGDCADQDNVLIQYLANPVMFKQVQSIQAVPIKHGSIGCVYTGLVHGEERMVCFKVIHPGIRTDIQEQSSVVSSGVNLAKFFGVSLDGADTEFTSVLIEETHLLAEAKNQAEVKGLWQDTEWLHIPMILPSLCTDNVLCSLYHPGIPLAEYIKFASASDINIICLNIARFIFRNHLVFNIFYIDIHWGNFMICPETHQLVVVDFGAIKRFSPEKHTCIKRLYSALIDEDYEAFLSVCLDLSITNPGRELYQFFLVQCQPWFKSEEFQFTPTWLKDSALVKLAWIQQLKLPCELMWLIRISVGLNGMLTHVQAHGEFYHALLDYL